MKILLFEEDEAYNLLKDDLSALVRVAIEEALSDMKPEPVEEDLWVGTKEAMKILGIRGSAKMQEIRDNSPMNGIRISKNGRIYRYFKPSLLSFLNKNVMR